MTARSTRLVAALTVGLALASPAPVAAGATSNAVFDDFDGASGVQPDGRYWDYDLGSVKGQLQTYTISVDNVRLDGEGHLIVQALPTAEGYTSARVVTRGKLHMMYGTLSARIKMPSGQGISPAFWLLGSDTGNIGWPHSGEIDIIELPSTATRYYATLHGPWVERPIGEDADYLFGTKGPIEDLSADFHTYWVTRSPGSIVIGVDDKTLGAFTPESLSSNQKWVFEQPMYAILNVAVGDKAAGAPDSTTPWPAAMLVDWFRWEPA